MADTPAAQAPLNTQQQAEAQAAQQAAIEKELAKNPRDETVPGGIYKRAGVDGYFNAEGEQIDKNGKKIKKADEE